jgi:hypothetical protein
MRCVLRGRVRASQLRTECVLTSLATQTLDTQRITQARCVTLMPHAACVHDAHSCVAYSAGEKDRDLHPIKRKKKKQGKDYFLKGVEGRDEDSPGHAWWDLLFEGENKNDDEKEKENEESTNG